MSEQMRDKFEAYMVRQNVCTSLARHRSDDTYRTITVQRAWDLWQAALATQPQAPQGDPNGWIEWAGGPYAGNAAEMIVVKLRDNSLSDGEARPAAEWCWVHSKDDPDCDIVAYRRAAPETPEGQK